MKTQTRQVQNLFAEYQDLKRMLFGQEKFVSVEYNPEMELHLTRFNQLQGLFFPQFRSKNWINPFISVDVEIERVQERA